MQQTSLFETIADALRPISPAEMTEICTPGYGTHTEHNLPKGWTFKETPGHGYLYPSDQANKNVPARVRANRYEEDCAYVIPIVFNKHLFTQECYNRALQSFKDWSPADYEKIFGVILQPGESGIKDKYYYLPNSHVGEYECGAAYGDWRPGVPKGYVMAFAGLVTPRTKYEIGNGYEPETEKMFLFPKSEFTSGMYFKPGQYPQWTDPTAFTNKGEFLTAILFEASEYDLKDKKDDFFAYYDKAGKYLGCWDNKAGKGKVEFLPHYY